MPETAKSPWRRAGVVTALLVLVTAGIVGTAGFHAHGNSLADADSAADAGRCQVCALGHTPALATPTFVATEAVAPDREPVPDVVHRPHTAHFERPSLGRAPPTC